MNEEILDLQSILEIPTTGQYDKETISKLDNYIKESNFAATTEAKKILERNNNFGFSTEQTILDIRNLAKDSILAKIYEEDKNQILNTAYNFLVDNIEKEVAVINTFIENDQEELAVKYAKGGVISYMEFDVGGTTSQPQKKGITIKASKLADLLTDNVALREEALSQMGGGSKRANIRLGKAIEAMRKDPNIEYNIDDSGQYNVLGETNSGGYSAAQAKAKTYKGQVNDPSLWERGTTFGENKAHKALVGTGSLYRRLTPEQRASVFGEELPAVEQTPVTTEPVKDDGKTREFGKQVTENMTHPLDAPKEETKPVKPNNSGGANSAQAGQSREKDFAGLDADEKIMYKFYWDTKGGSNPEAFGTTQDGIHKFLMSRISNKDKDYLSNLAGIKKDLDLSKPEGAEGKPMGGSGYSSSTPFVDGYKGLPKEETKTETKPKEEDEIGSGVAGLGALAAGIYGGKKAIGALKDINIKNPTKGLAGTLTNYISSFNKKKNVQKEAITRNDKLGKAYESAKTEPVVKPRLTMNADVKSVNKPTETVAASTKPKYTVMKPGTEKTFKDKKVSFVKARDNGMVEVKDSSTGKNFFVKAIDLKRNGGRLFQQGGVNMNSQSKYSDQFKNRAGNVGISDGMGNNLKKEIARIDSELDAIMQELNKSRETKQSVQGTKSYSNVANNTDLRDKELRRHAETLIAQKKRLSQRNFGSNEKLNDSLLTMNKGGMIYKNGGMMNILLKKKVNIN